MASDRFSELFGDRRGAGPEPTLEPVEVPDVRVRIMKTRDKEWCAHVTHDRRELHINLSGLGIKDDKSKRRRELISDIGTYMLWVVRQNPGIHFEELDREALHACALFTRKSMDQRTLDSDIEP